MLNYSSPRAIDDYLAENGLAASKRFGQNFLVNPDARRLLVSAALRGDPESVWEIGPGLGALTDGLAASGTRLTLFEIDLGFSRLLTERYSDESRVRLVTGDFVETWQEVYRREGYPDVIVGNLPYNSAAQIVLRMFEGAATSRLVFTVQAEVAKRMTAAPSTSEYSSFSIICGAGWRITLLGRLGAGSFHPRPRVESTMLELAPRIDSLACDRAFFLELCRALFRARRKTVRNNLVDCSCLEPLSTAGRLRILEENGLSPEARSEQFAPETMVRLAESYFRAIVTHRPRPGNLRRSDQ